MEKSAKIFIAGHGGLVGSAVVRRFKKEGFTNLILRTRAQLDLRDGSEVERFFVSERPEYVILSAAKVGGVASHAAHQYEMLHENLLIQNSVIDSSFRNGAKRLLFIASGTIYPTECEQPISENALLQGPFDRLHEPYGLAKVCGLKMCEKIRQESGRDFFTIVPTNMYGEGDTFEEGRSSVIASLIKRFYQAKISGAEEVPVWGSGNALREFLYVDDMADAILYFLSNPPTSAFVNIGSSEEFSIRDIANAIAKVVGYNGRIIFDSTKPEGRLRRKLNTSLAESFGWTSRTGIDEGLNKLFKYYLDSSQHGHFF